jgi:hypothetical protein
MEKLHGLDVYVAEPPTGVTPKGVVVIIPDGSTHSAYFVTRVEC